MQPAFSTRIPDGLLAAMRLGGEKPHQGLPGRNPALYQGPTACNSTTALGLRGQAELNRVGSCSTGKERDAESGNDYFEARYYSSSMGRFMSPDWSAKEEPVPYAKLDDPQTLNLYAYVGNDPLTRNDPDGHTFGLDDLVGAGLGALVGMGVEAGKDLMTGEHITFGKMAGGAIGGAIEGWALVNAPESGGASLLVGGASGLASNAVKQTIDTMTGQQKNIDPVELGTSTVVGALSNGAASRLPKVSVPGVSSGRGNMAAISKGLQTKGLTPSLKTASKGALGRETASSLKTYVAGALGAASNAASTSPPLSAPKAPVAPACAYSGNCK